MWYQLMRIGLGLHTYMVGDNSPKKPISLEQIQYLNICGHYFEMNRSEQQLE